jgi:aminopeptidase N
MDYFSDRVMYNTYIGHEMAHLWWNKADADSWEDWLNEAFAEYSSLLIVREIFGRNEFQNQMMERTKNIDNTKAIWGINRRDPEAYYILYHKGAIILNELELKIGNKAFLALCHSYHKLNIRTTGDFLDLLKSQEGEEMNIWFEKMLKTK